MWTKRLLALPLALAISTAATTAALAQPVNEPFDPSTIPQPVQDAAVAVLTQLREDLLAAGIEEAKIDDAIEWLADRAAEMPVSDEALATPDPGDQGADQGAGEGPEATDESAGPDAGEAG